MKKRLQGLVAGILIGATVTCGLVFAKDASETAQIFYHNIKIFISGAEIVPKDANGNIVEPFTMNGTTYLPVRAISNAFGHDVEWDGATQSVYIGKKDQTKPDTYLEKLQYNDYKEALQENKFSVINGTITDYNNTTYTNGILFYNYYPGYTIEDDSDDASILIAYPLNSQYKNLKGKIVLPKSINIATLDKKDNIPLASADIWFYGDGKPLYKATAVTSSMPFSFDIDTRGVNQLTIKLTTDNDYSYVALTDLALYK